jgi:hypothetical protein
VKRLRIELGSELLDLIFRDLDSLTLEAHPQRQVFEPLDHRLFLNHVGGLAAGVSPSCLHCPILNLPVTGKGAGLSAIAKPLAALRTVAAKHTEFGL